MATTKVGIYRSYHGTIPLDSSGQPLPQSEWPRKRAHSWVVRWFGTDGDRYSKSFENRKEAEHFAEGKQTDVRHGKADPPKRLTLGEFYKEHRELMKNTLRPKTLHMHLATLALFAEQVGWNRCLTAVATRDIERFRARRLEQGMAAATVNRELRAMKRLFNLAIPRGYLADGTNPVESVQPLKVGRKRPAYCSAPDFRSLADRAPDAMWQTVLVLIYTTGIRLREAMNLTWSDIDFAAGIVHVTRKPAKAYVQAWTPKDHELRSIPLSEQAVKLLSSWQTTAPVGCPYVFMEPDRWDYYRQRVDARAWKGEQDLVNNVLRRFKTLCKRAGIGPYTIHDLRRSCITNWAKQLPIHVVQQLAGHSDIKTTQEYYLSVQPEDLTKAQAVQQSLVSGILERRATDQELTKSGQKRCFPKRRVFAGTAQPPES